MKCAYCGAEFESDNPAKKYCSADCCVKNSRARARERYLKLNPPRQIKCAFCGKEFTTIYVRQKYCSERCCSEAHKQKDKARIILQKQCSNCGKKFITRRSDQLYCSAECADCYTSKKPPLLKPKRQAKPSGKTIDDWCREAAECNLDYGNYRALIAQGKSFDELKAQAPFRQTPAHSHITWGKMQ